jgi:hypothetical protein
VSFVCAKLEKGISVKAEKTNKTNIEGIAGFVFRKFIIDVFIITNLLKKCVKIV